MEPSLLAQPVAVLARPTVPIPKEDSVALAVRRLRESGAGIIPVSIEGLYSGAVTERSAAEALANGVEMTEMASRAVDKASLTVQPHVTGAEALRLFNELGAPGLVVVDGSGRIIGVLTPSDLFPRHLDPPRPTMIGGMATPFGVYLTTGTVRGGASGLALVTTGMLLFVLLLASTTAANYAVTYLYIHGMDEGAVDLVGTVIELALFGLLVRMMPLSRIHAAEHKVVHAIERGEELTPEIVKRMPRVHPRCGTNLAVGATIFLLIATTPLISSPIIRPVVALVATLFLWRPMGSLAQRYVTTAPPKARHIDMGIRAGKELLENYVTSPLAMPSFFQRIYNSGMLHVMLGSSITCGVAALVSYLLHVDFLGGII